MSFTKKASALLLALVLAFSLSVPAFATTNSDGDMTITSGSVTFTNESYAYFDAETGEDLTAYTSYAQLSSSSNFAHLPVIINFTGTGLKINGTTVPTSNNSYDGYINVSGTCATVEVIYSGGTRTYYVAAYPATFHASVTLDYSNAHRFSNLSAGASYTGIYGRHCSYLNPATQAQINTATAAVAALDAKFPDGVYKSATYSNMGAGKTAADILFTFGSERGLTIGGSTSYISSVEGLDMDSTATYTYYGYTSGAGGWMYSVTRGDTTMYPMISAGSFKLMPNDVVNWSYTCDLGYDLNYPMM